MTGAGFYVFMHCPAWHPDLRQPWGSGIACQREHGHRGMHYGHHVATDLRPGSRRQAVAW